MLIVDVTKEKNIDAALKKLRNKYRKTGVRKELTSRSEHIKKSTKKREEKRKAIYVQKLRDAEQDL
jgi:small subunit ribosomal protein S21